MDVKDIVRKFIEQNGYDGLFSPEGECACLADDLSPGDCLAENCEAGYRVDEEHDWHITYTKPATE